MSQQPRRKAPKPPPQVGSIVKEVAESKGIEFSRASRRTSQSRKESLRAFSAKLRRGHNEQDFNTLNHDSSVSKPVVRPNMIYQPAVGSVIKANNPYIVAQDDPLDMKATPSVLGMELRDNLRTRDSRSPNQSISPREVRSRDRPRRQDRSKSPVRTVPNPLPNNRSEEGK